MKQPMRWVVCLWLIRMNVKRNFLVRSVAGIVFATLLILCCVLGFHAIMLLGAFLVAMGLYEYAQLIRRLTDAPLKLWIFIPLGVVIFLLSGFVSEGQVENKFLLLPLAIFPIWISMELFRPKGFQPLRSGLILLGSLYVVIPFAALLEISVIHGMYEWEIPLGILLMMWANDTGAYLAGITMGRRKLASAISPNKTWEGLWGGVVLTIVTSWAYSRYSLALSESLWLISAPIISSFGTLGDLFESKLKRIAGVKDSGKIMPGHGGVLDRFDGLLFALPILCLLYKLLLV